jgi:predicted glycoside hydrolase/deacetylase ChbG (UPF0249 family)
MKHLILCADDYGQNSAISQAVVTLLQKKCLSATGCLTTAPGWLASAELLKPLKDQCDIGLHFNLTDGKSLSPALKEQGGFKPLRSLFLQAYFKKLDQAAIEKECHAQLDKFIEGIGRAPDFIDGHQHVHQFPVIRDAILRVYDERLREHGSYVRLVFDPEAWQRVGQVGYIKNIMIQLTGAQQFNELLEEYDIPHNSSFAGVYDFAHSERYPIYFPKFLERVSEDGLIMLHPAKHMEAGDPISEARAEEYRYLMSNVFTEVCHNQQIVISRFYHK